ncbi:MAG: hypothetical protein ACOC1J_03505, partial [Prolixibacteraceae bacterium]
WPAAGLSALPVSPASGFVMPDGGLPPVAATGKQNRVAVFNRVPLQSLPALRLALLKIWKCCETGNLLDLGKSNTHYRKNFLISYYLFLIPYFSLINWSFHQTKN